MSAPARGRLLSAWESKTKMKDRRCRTTFPLSSRQEFQQIMLPSPSLPLCLYSRAQPPLAHSLALLRAGKGTNIASPTTVAAVLKSLFRLFVRSRSFVRLSLMRGFSDEGNYSRQKRIAQAKSLTQYHANERANEASLRDGRREERNGQSRRLLLFLPHGRRAGGNERKSRRKDIQSGEGERASEGTAAVATDKDTEEREVPFVSGLKPCVRSASFVQMGGRDSRASEKARSRATGTMSRLQRSPESVANQFDTE